jgi:Flp pilus assembly protein TadG
MTALGRRWLILLREEHGSATAELVVITPIVILMLLFVVLCGRLADTNLRLNDAAHQAARAATTARSPATAASDAATAAHAALDQAGVACQSLTLQTDTQGLRPGSTVTVTLSCTLGMSDLTLLSLPGTVTRQASFSSVVDVYRGTTATTAGGPAR